MIKKGFTLQELLITMGIIGIVAALTIPGVISMMPDKNKTMYMKAYNTLTTLTDEILGDSSLYWTNYNAATGAPTCEGMRCLNIPIDTRINNAFSATDWDEGAKKFGVCLASKLNIKETFGSDIIFGTSGDDGVRFTTIDGIQWTYEPNNINDQKITINLNPTDANATHNCVYSDNCTNPNQYEFEIDQFGGIQATDALGRAYLENPTDMHSKNQDLSRAKELLSDKVTKTEESKGDEEKQ